MVVEGARGAASFVAKKTSELATRGAEMATKGAEHVARATESFTKRVTEATTKEKTTSAVDAIASNTEQPIAKQIVENVQPIEGGADADGKITIEVDKAKAERAQKEIQFKERFDSRFAPLKNELNEEYKAVEKRGDGLPSDNDTRNQYLDKYTEARNTAYNAELKATLHHDFEETYPPPNKDTEPDKFDQWITDREAYMNSADEAKQEAEKVAKEAESGAGAEKQKAEGEDGEEVAEETKEDASASMSNAFRLANQLENAQNDNVRKQIEGKIQGIHDKNQEARPQFKTRVKIAQTIQIGKAVLLMSGMGLATNAISSVAVAGAK